VFWTALLAHTHNADVRTTPSQQWSRRSGGIAWRRNQWWTPPAV